MANPKKPVRHASALKAKRQAKAREKKNFQIRSRVRTLTINVHKAITEKNLEKALAAFKIAQAAWQKAAKTGIFHRNAAARKVSVMASGLAKLTKK